MIIKNVNDIGTTLLREKALDIINAGIIAVLPSKVMVSALKYVARTQTLRIFDDNYPLGSQRLFVIGGGKAASLMALSIEKIIGTDRITAGVVNCVKDVDKTQKHRIEIVVANHPIPDQQGVYGVKQMLALKKRYSITPDDLVLCLISGGASALMPLPLKGISLTDKKRITQLLLASGADIAEVNTVRKHISEIKGGRLGQYFNPTKVISLILSDVVGDDLSVIASGPTYPDPTTFEDAWYVLEKYKLLNLAPENVLNVLQKGCRGEIRDTPKTLYNCVNYIIGNNQLALEAMSQKAKEIGFHPIIVSSKQIGDTGKVALARSKEIINNLYHGYDAIIIGGETTLVLTKDHGKGGRNQHYAAVTLLALHDYGKEWLLISVGSDGSDFLPNIAGALVDRDSAGRIGSEKINIASYIKKYDTNTLFKKIGNSLLVTGNTGTNVGDLILYLLPR